ncbi:MAG: HPr family phosphocarrier protein [Defluviitaleaceae bacterium]|nr:HPr family phosphocarrier protein [Defluviitaleaceae bacterium]
MKSIKIYLDTIDKVKGFVNVVSVCDGDFDLSSGRYVVDAKSIMGIFSLDLSKTLTLNIHSEEVADRIIPQLKAFEAQ